MKQLATRLYQASGYGEVNDILSEKGYKNSEDNWKPLGGSKATRSSVLSQSGREVVPVVELIYNSYDAIAMKSYINENPQDEPQTLQEAYDRFVDDMEEIEMIASGGEDPDICIRDTGLGQKPEDFENSFLDTEDPGLKKDEFDFIQGHFGMGSTGCHKKADGDGTHGQYKLIISASYEEQNNWGYSLVRRNTDKETYEYLVIDGEVPSFKGQFHGQDYGSFVQVYSYQMSVGSSSGSFISKKRPVMRRIERIMFNPPHEVKVRDERRDQANTYTIQGHRKYLVDDTYGNVVDHHVNVNKRYDINGLGNAEIDIYVLEEYNESGEKHQFLRTRDMPVVYLVNGQMHGREPKYFIKKCGLDGGIKNDLVVAVDFSDSPILNNVFDMAEVFHPTRDRLEDNIKKEVQDKTAEAVKNQDILREINDRRLGSSSDGDNELEEDFKEYVESSDIDKEYISTGDVKVGGGGSGGTGRTPRPEFEFSEPPTEFSPIIRERRKEQEKPILHDENEPFKKEVSVDKDTASVKFWIDAPDSYADELKKDGFPLLLLDNFDTYESLSIDNGVMNLSFDVSDIQDEDQSVSVTVFIKHESDDLSSNIEFTGIDTGDSNGGGEGGGEDSVGMPDVMGVRESDWESYGMDEETTILYYDNGDSKDISEHNILINLDVNQVQEYRKENEIKSEQKEKMESVYKNNLAIYAVSIYHKLNDNFEQDKYEISISDIVEDACSGVSNTILTLGLDESEG